MQLVEASLAGQRCWSTAPFLLDVTVIIAPSVLLLTVWADVIPAASAVALGYLALVAVRRKLQPPAPIIVAPVVPVGLQLSRTHAKSSIVTKFRSLIMLLT